MPSFELPNLCPDVDELLGADVEPCETCGTGISTMTCYDEIRRCKTCVISLAESRGWM